MTRIEWPGRAANRPKRGGGHGHKTAFAATVPCPDHSPIRAGQPVIIRDAFGKEHPAVAHTGPVWGHDFAVIWVRMIDGKPGHALPWPVEDVGVEVEGQDDH